MKDLKHVGSITLLIAAALWLWVALLPLTEIGPGLDPLDLVKDLSKDLQRVAYWNFWAALVTGLATVLQVADRYVPWNRRP